MERTNQFTIRVGVAISPELVEHIVALAVSAFGIVEIVRSEKTGK